MNEIEKTIIIIIRDNHLVRKSELYQMIKNNGLASISTERIKESISSLMKMNYITSMSPLGEESYMLTKEGIRSI